MARTGQSRLKRQQLVERDIYGTGHPRPGVFVGPAHIEDGVRRGAGRQHAARERADRSVRELDDWFDLSPVGMVLFDEPSQGLAPKVVQDVLKTIRRLKQEGIAVLVVEQNVQSALAVADRVYVMSRGCIVHQGPAEALRTDAAQRVELLGV